MSRPDERTGLTSPPAGTGNVPGLSEAFKMNLGTGQGVYSYRLPLPDGVAGHTPRLALEYTHGTGLGAFGLGWRLPVRSISRRLDYGVPREGVAERFLDSGLEIVRLADSTFGPLAESSFTRYSRSGDGWRIEERNGNVHELGLQPAFRLTPPDRPGQVQEWLLERTRDPAGNAITYSYDLHGGWAYVSQILYAAYAIRFVYEDRPDVRQDGRAGFLRVRARRCRAVELFLDPGTAGERRIRSWTLSYEQDPQSGVSLLASFRLVSHGAAANGSQDVRQAPVVFNYSRFEPQQSSVRFLPAPEGPQPPPLSEPDTALVTLDETPLPGILQVAGGRQYYWRNRGDDGWAAPRPVSRTPALSSFAQSGVALLDADGSGTADLVVAGADPLHGYYENGGSAGWSRFVAYPRGRRATPPWTSGRLRLTDSDGDGRIDAIESGRLGFTVWLNQGEQGWSEPLLAPRGSGDGDAPGFDDPQVHLADMSGDGLQDLVRVRSGRVEVWPSLGRGRFGPPRVMANSPRLPGLDRDSGSLFLLDVDGDGCADLVRVSAHGVEVRLNRNGQGFAEPVLLDTVPPPIPGTVRAANLRGRSGAGLVWNSPRGNGTAYVSVEIGTGAPAYLLAGIDNGAGLFSELFYRSAVEDALEDARRGSPWRTNLPFPLLVVAGTRETDRTSGQVAETSYRYHEGHFEPRTRQFQGFRRTERTEKGDESRADTLTVFHFLMGEERLPGHGPEHATLNGMLRRTETFALDGSALASLPYRTEESDHGLQVLGDSADGRKRVFFFVGLNRTEDRERTGDVRGEEKTYTYDALGNVTRERLRAYGTRGGAAQPERVKTTEVTYAISPTRWLIDKPSRIVVRDEANAILSETRRYYDGPDFQGLGFGRTRRGLLAREEKLVLSRAAFDTHYTGMDAAALGYQEANDADGQPAMFLLARRNAWDARGLQVAERDPLGHETRFEYSADGLFRTKLTDVLGETRFETDRATGQTTLIVYADGSEARFIHDTQGRVLHSLLPVDDPARPPRVFSYDDTAVPHSRTVRFRLSDTPGDEARAVTYFDGRGKELQHRVETGGGRVVVSGLSLKNPWNDVKREYEPTDAATLAFSLPDTAGKPHRELFYDARGRVVRTVDFSGGVSTAEYRPFEVALQDADDTDGSAENVARGQANTPRREELDVLLNRTRIVEDLGGGVTAVTAYTVDAAGNLREIRDSRGVLCSYKYDRLGRRQTVDHREAGRRRLWYDARGKVVRTLDAKGTDVRAEIDPAGRLRRLRVGADILEEYRYDDLARNALGRVAEVTYRGGGQTFRYDRAGRLVRREHRFEGVAAVHFLAYEYDPLGREIAVTHTDGTRIARRLGPNGWVVAIPGVLNQVVYDPRGLPTRLVFANGVTTDLTYTPGPGRVKTQRTTGPGGQVMEDLSYTFDRLGLILESRDAAPGGSTLDYAYDPLYQLRQVTTTTGAAAPVTRRYDYNDFYNLTRIGEAGNRLHYDDTAHPNRASGITRGSDPQAALAYDANGNLLGLPGRSFQYNFKDELVRCETTAGLVAEYRYDHEGQRVSKTVDDGPGQPLRTLFIGEEAEIRDGVPAYFVRLGSLRVAIRQGGTTRFVHSNYLGSSVFFSDAAGVKIAAIAYRPFGNVASASGTIDFRMFGAHPFDAESGLVYMKRRYYAPDTGRFLTPDPLALYQPQKFLTRPRALHPYAYGGNDPVNNADPDGLSFWSVVGAIVGVIVAVVLAAAVVMTGGLLLGIIAAIGIMAVSYLVADATAGTGFGEFMRGFMIGFNAGLNAVLATALFGPVVGISLGVINFLAAFDSIASSPVYQGILGWSSWLMPMSWLATGVGLIFFVINLVAAGLSGNSGAATIRSISIDWGTGTIVTHGGLLTLVPGGYNLGNFAYIHRNSAFSTSLVQHETGHTLNVAAYGAIFHYIGAIDENVIPGRGAAAYAERLADSHDPTRAVPDPSVWSEMWV